MTQPDFQALIAGRFLDGGGGIHNIRHPEYGAVGDGSTIEDDALRAAHRDGVPYIPVGTYRISSEFEDIWTIPFQSAGRGVTLLQGDRTYDISGAIAGEFCMRHRSAPGSDEGFIELVSARTGRRIARIANEASSSQSHRITLPIEIRRNSHALILQPEELEGRTDILWRTARDSDVFMLSSTTQPGAERLVLLVDTSAARPDGEKKDSYAFDEAIAVPSNNPTEPIEIRNLHLLLRRELRFWARASGNQIRPGDIEVRLVPTGNAFRLTVRDLTSGEEQTDLKVERDALSLKGFAFPNLRSSQEAPKISSGTNRFAIPLLTENAVPFDRPFLRDRSKNIGGHVKLVTTIGNASPGGSGAIIREYVYGGGILRELSDRSVRTVREGLALAGVRKTGEDLVLHIDIPGGERCRIAGYLEWTVSGVPR